MAAILHLKMATKIVVGSFRLMKIWNQNSKLPLHAKFQKCMLPKIEKMQISIFISWWPFWIPKWPPIQWLDRLWPAIFKSSAIYYPCISYSSFINSLFFKKATANASDGGHFGFQNGYQNSCRIIQTYEYLGQALIITPENQVLELHVL